ncbi:MAG: AAA family ATPase, partial [Desulfomonilaceae bacterium]
MKLKRLEIFGFKSFPEKTLIDFCDGVTSVVGSNGSGKSNIIEAIRWVMGEQRTRTLRCKKMEDLIFNGSDSLKPLGMAEVRLTLTNGGRPFPPPMSDYDEVMVARRLYRDGKSEYELNGVSCRLTDIIDFFLDTGIGRNSYAIIEQGRVEQIIAAKPEERRIFLEEAASINRYKARRESAIKKLEQTNENLLRIKDIVFEVKKQSQLLKKQAKKAERYRELKNRIRDLEINLEASKCQRVSEKLNQLKNSQEMLVNELTEKETRLGKLTANLESTRLQISEIQISFNELSEKLRFAEIESNNAETALANFLSRENELKERRQRIEANRDSLIRNETAAQNRLKELELQHKELLSSHSQFSEKLKSSQKLIGDLKKASDERDGTLEQFRNDLFQALQDLSRSRNQLEQNLRRQTELKTRLNKFRTDFLNQSESLGKTLEQKDLSEQGSLKIQQSLDLIESEFENNREKRSTMVNELKSLNEKMRELEKNSISIKTKLESLNEQNRNYASYGSGTQFVMKHFSSLGNLDILKPVAELIQCPPEYSTALTSALNTLLGAIVVKDFSCALELAEKIKDLEISRVDIVPLDSFDLDVPDQLIQQDHIKKLSDLVTAAPSFKGLVNRLLRDFYVVKNLSFAKNFFRNFRKNIRIVTLKGEIIVPESFVSLGSLESPEKDVLSKKFETDSLIIQVADVDRQIHEVKTIIAAKELDLIKLSRKIE